MAAALDRPVHIVGDAEGTALGAAALGLFALGPASTLTEAAAQLVDPGTSPPAPVVADPALVATYDRLRASIPGLIGALGSVAGLFAGVSDGAASATGGRAC
jgi:gluconokinase